MSETLIERLGAVNAKLNGLPSRLGVPQNTSQVVLEQATTQTLMVPNPTIIKVSPKGLEQYLGVEAVAINVEHLWLKNIPRTYSEETLKKASYLLKASLLSSGIYTGVRHQYVAIDVNQILVYHVLVRLAKPK